MSSPASDSQSKAHPSATSSHFGDSLTNGDYTRNPTSSQIQTPPQTPPQTPQPSQSSNPPPTTQTDNLYTQSPSSSTAGFFQAPPRIPNQYTDDAALLRGLSLFLPRDVHVQQRISSDLTTFGDRVLSRHTLGLVLDAERNLPFVKHWDTWGQRRDELITSTGWKDLQRMGIEEGIVAIPYENAYAEYSRVYWCAKYVLWCGSSAWVNCPSLMVDGVASAFRMKLSSEQGWGEGGQKQVIRDAYERLVSRDAKRAWTTGQWMTERQGGSDVSMTETLARFDPGDGLRGRDVNGNELGPWRLDGFKWFSSATDADMLVLLGRTEKGLSLFYAPMRKAKEKDVLGHESELNGVYIQRLKNKLGTKALPTAELELKGVRGWMVGEEGRGTKEIATVLNIARVHNGLTAIGLWGRGLAVVRAFTKVRVVGRKPLWKKTGFMRTLARMHTEYRANVMFNFFVSALLGCVEQEQIAAFHGQAGSGKGKLGQLPGIKDTATAEWLLRVLTPALKGHCSKTAIGGLQECMESMGGVGYLENDDMQFNIARLYRDANVLPIWEGTTDMMADDSVIRALCGKTKDAVMGALSDWVSTSLQQTSGFGEQRQILECWWGGFKDLLTNATKEEIELKARSIMTRLVDITQGILLIADANSDDDEVAKLVVQAWFNDKSDKSNFELSSNWTSKASSDMKIVFGQAGLEAVQAKL